MNIVWEPKKAKTNYLKHQIRFSDAELVLFDPLALSREDEDTEGERRFVSIGSSCVYLPWQKYPINFSPGGNIKGKETI